MDARNGNVGDVSAPDIGSRYAHYRSGYPLRARSRVSADRLINRADIGPAELQDGPMLDALFESLVTLSVLGPARRTSPRRSLREWGPIMTFLNVVWLVLPGIWLLAALIIAIPVALMPLGNQIMVTQ